MCPLPKYLADGTKLHQWSCYFLFSQFLYLWLGESETTNEVLGCTYLMWPISQGDLCCLQHHLLSDPLTYADNMIYTWQLHHKSYLLTVIFTLKDQEICIVEQNCLHNSLNSSRYTGMIYTQREWQPCQLMFCLIDISVGYWPVDNTDHNITSDLDSWVRLHLFHNGVG